MTVSVLHLANHCERGGNVHLAVDLACAQAATGARVWFASAGGRYADLLEQHGVKHILIRQSLRPSWHMASDVGALLSLCRSLRPDVVHAHMMSGAVLGRLAAWLSGARLVTTVHNSFDVHSGLMRMGDVVVAISKTEYHALLERKFSETRLKLVVNGTLGSPRTAGARNGAPCLPRPCVTTLCGLERRKGVHDVITAFARVAGRAPLWSLVVVGDGPERKALEDQAATVGCAGRIRFLGHVDASAEVLSQSDIFVQASSAEPFGLSILEARNAGCAVIGTAVGGIVEQLGSGKHGRLVPPGRPDLLAEALSSLMTDDRALREARRRAGEDLAGYRVERMAGEYLDLYRTVIQQRESGFAGRRDHPAE